nr:hypothetical protein [Clostridium sp. Marseille-P7770]
MGKCYCVIVETGKGRFERARERRNRRRIRALLAAGGTLLRYAVVMCILMMMALGIGVTILAATKRPDFSVVGAVMITFVISGPIAEALME